MKIFIILFIIFSTSFAQKIDFSEFQNLDHHKNLLPEKLQRLLTKEKQPEFLDAQIQNNLLRKENNTFMTQLDSVVLIELVSFNEDVTNLDSQNLDTTKQIFSYSPVANTISRTKKYWNGKEWRNKYRTTSTYDLNLRFAYRLSEDWLIDNWVGNYRSTYDYYQDGRSHRYFEEGYDGNDWYNQRRITHEYNDFGSESLLSIENWLNGNWVYSYKRILEYDNDNSLVLDLRESWEHGELSHISTSSYTYTSLNKIASYNYEVVAQGRRTYGDRYVNYFDETGNLTKRETQVWENDEWINSYLFSYEYYPNGNTKTFLFREWEDSTWNNSFRLERVYDEMGNIFISTNFVWREGVLENSWRETHSYNDNHQELTLLSESLNNENPQNIYFYEYQYDEYGKETYYIYKQWINEEWEGKYRRFRNYNEDGNVVDGIAEIWDNGWKPGNYSFSYPGPDGYSRWGVEYYKMKAHYSKVESVDYSSPNKYELFQNFPNPFNISTQIYFMLSSETQVKLEVFDILGQRISVLINEELPKGTHSIDYKAAGISSGVFIYRLSTEEFIQTKKMILLK